VSIGQAARAAGTDFYFNSWRVIPANIAFAFVLLVIAAAAAAWPPCIALVPLAAIPLAGLHRMAALLARNEPAAFGDFVDGMRRFGVAAVLLAAGAALIGAVLVTNALIGFGGDNPLGWFLAASALYGLVALAMFLVAAWPVLVDPNHSDATLRRRLQLAGFVLVGRPVRLFLLTALVVAILVVSTVALAGIVLVGVAYASLVATRWVLPSVDDLEARYEAAHVR